MNLKQGCTVKVRPTAYIEQEFLGRTGKLEIVDPYASEGDYYGVKFAGRSGHLFFNTEELEVVSEQQTQATA